MKADGKLASLGTLPIATFIVVACPSLAWGVCDASSLTALEPAARVTPALDMAAQAALVALVSLIWIAAFLLLPLVQHVNRKGRAEGGV